MISEEGTSQYMLMYVEGAQYVSDLPWDWYSLATPSALKTHNPATDFQTTKYGTYISNVW